MIKNKSRIEILNGKLQKNLSIFNTMIANITSLNSQIEEEICIVEEEITSKQEEINNMKIIKTQNEKIKSNFESLLN